MRDEDDDGGLGFLPWTWPKPVRAPDPPGGFPRRRPPKASRKRERQREQERERRAERLHAAALSRIGVVIAGSAVIVAAILVIALIAADH